ncbi:MAG: hypothetical protein MZV63_07215 [Marinilabiliales bacterium]|nr:hypothetical protein [Marinilabiliales bacterium]
MYRTDRRYRLAFRRDLVTGMAVCTFGIANTTKVRLAAPQQRFQGLPSAWRRWRWAVACSCGAELGAQSPATRRRLTTLLGIIVVKFILAARYPILRCQPYSTEIPREYPKPSATVFPSRVCWEPSSSLWIVAVLAGWHSALGLSDRAAFLVLLVAEANHVHNRDGNPTLRLDEIHFNLLGSAIGVVILLLVVAVLLDCPCPA